jgi:hypothetical protein
MDRHEAVFDRRHVHQLPLTEDDGAGHTEAALGGTFQRLAQVKAQWDPQNVFGTNRNIRPA